MKMDIDLKIVCKDALECDRVTNYLFEKKSFKMSELKMTELKHDKTVLLRIYARRKRGMEDNTIYIIKQLCLLSGVMNIHGILTIYHGKVIWYTINYNLKFPFLESLGEHIKEINSFCAETINSRPLLICKNQYEKPMGNPIGSFQLKMNTKWGVSSNTVCNVYESKNYLTLRLGKVSLFNYLIKEISLPVKIGVNELSESLEKKGFVIDKQDFIAQIKNLVGAHEKK